MRTRGGFGLGGYPVDMGGGPGQRLVEVAEAARQIALEHGRQDLADRLERQSEQMTTAQVRVLVAGDFKQGKSTLVNALAGSSVCPVEDDRSTAMVTEIVSDGAVAPSAELIEGDRTEQVPYERALGMVNDPPEAAVERWWDTRVVLHVTAPTMAARDSDADGPPVAVAGAALIDMPGVHGVAGAPVLQAALAGVAAVLFVSDAGAELTRAELAGLGAVAATGVPVALVVPKIDFYPAWRKVAELDRGHLARRGLDVAAFPVSSPLLMRGASTGDGEMAAEAGFAPLEAWIREELAASAARRTAAVVDEVRMALAGVRAVLQAKLGGTDESGRVLADLEERASRLRVLTGDRARWRRVVTDGIADLEPEGEHLLRDRLRAVQRDAEAAIGQGTPVGGWTRFSFWLAQRTVADVAAVFGELEARATHVSAAARDAFEDDEADAVALAPVRPPSLDPSELIDSTSELDRREAIPAKRTARVRQSVRRIDTTGVLEGLAMVSLNPVSVAAGLMISRRAVQGSGAQVLQEQRSAALEAVRRHLEEAEYVARKEWRAAVRRMERDLRDGYEEVAESLARSAADAWRAARDASDDEEARERAERDVALIARLDDEAVALAAGG